MEVENEVKQNDDAEDNQLEQQSQQKENSKEILLKIIKITQIPNLRISIPKKLIKIINIMLALLDWVVWVLVMLR